MLKFDPERDLLSNMVFLPDETAKTSTLDPLDIQEDLWRELFIRLRALYNRGIKFSYQELVNLCSDLKGMQGFDRQQVGKFFLNMAQMSVGCLAPTESLVRTIRYNGRKVRLQAALEQTKGKVASTESQALVDQLKAELELLNFSEDFDSTVSLRSVHDEITSDLKELPKIYQTGLSQLDEALGGGLFAGKCYGLAARKKSGKTAMLATLAQNLNKFGHRCTYVALEMGRKEITQRILAREIGENPISFLTDRRNMPDFQRKVEMAQSKFNNLDFIDRAGITFEELKRTLLLNFRANKPKVIIIDYWQLIGGGNNKKSTAEHLDQIAQWLAEFAKLYNVAIIMASQINQTGGTRGSEGLKLAFDMIFTIHKLEGTDKETLLWMEMTDSRYTLYKDIGSDSVPSFRINPKGVYFEQL